MATESPAEAVLTQPFGFYSPDRELQDGEFTAAAISGFSVQFFDFFEPGGTGHLLPGRTLEQTKALSFPAGSSLIFALMGFTGAFVTTEGVSLRERELGQFSVWTEFRQPNILACKVRLTAQGMDQPVRIQVQTVTLFF